MRRTSRKATLAPAARACVQCRRRKSRCLPGNKDGDPCCFCQKAGKTCSFEGPPVRTSLTRKNLDAAEHRCAQLRCLLQSLHPELEIESALQGHTEVIESPATVEADETTPDTFEWHEGSLSPELKASSWNDTMSTDGMATLTTATGSGYLGSSSGSRLLEEIDSSMTGTVRQKRRRKIQHKSYQSQVTPPDPSGLSASYVVNNLIDAYFHLYNVYYPILHEKTFRDRVGTGQHHKYPRSPWRVTYHMALAIGHWASSSEHEHMKTNYYTAARASMSLHMLESGTVETVQAFLLMGNYLQMINRTNTGYNFVGLAYRMAIGLGLHREFSSTGTMNTIGHERRRQLFWTIYSFESGFNITTGRPPTMTDGFIDINLPLNIDDKESTLRDPVPEEVDYPTTYSSIIAHAKLARIADSIYHEYLLAKTAGSRMEFRLAELLERDLNAWRKALPSYFASDISQWFLGPRSVLRWKEQNLRILLWRGSQKYHNFLPTRFNAEEKCLDVAMESVHDIATFCMAYQDSLYHGLIWYATYFLVQASLAILVGFLGKDNSESHHDQEPPFWHHAIYESRDCLRKLARQSISAARCMEMLDRICSRFESFPTLNSSPNPEIYSLSNEAPELAIPPLDEASQQIPDFLRRFSENDLMFGDENQLTISDDVGDPNLRTLMNEVSLDLMGNMPLDLLFNDWVESPS